MPVSATDMGEPVFGEQVSVQRTRIVAPWVIAAMSSMAGECIVGWEANGGLLHASPITTGRGTLAPLPTRDAALPIVVALRIAAEAKQRGSSLLGEVDALPSRHSRAGLLDAIDPARSAALKRRYAMPRADLRGARWNAGAFAGFGSDGQSQALQPSDVAALTRLWARLQRHFTAADGFGLAAGRGCQRERQSSQRERLGRRSENHSLHRYEHWNRGGWGSWVTLVTRSSAG